MTPSPRWLALLVFALTCDPAQPAAQTTDEYRLKAAFVYRFHQFVEWPDAAVEDARTLDVCVLRPNPFGSDLEQLASGESLNGRPLRVRVVAGPVQISGCHVLFVSAGSEASGVLKAVAGRPVLTVGETDRFLGEGGIITLKLVERRVRFEVNATNAQRAGLRLNVQLLKLATAVHGGPE